MMQGDDMVRLVTKIAHEPKVNSDIWLLIIEDTENPNANPIALLPCPSPDMAELAEMQFAKILKYLGADEAQR